MKNGSALIADERQRQIEVEGWTPSHDGNHDLGELAVAAACYALPQQKRLDELSMMDGMFPPDMFPFDPDWWKPTPDDRVRELTKAGALIAAEIDRLQNL